MYAVMVSDTMQRTDHAHVVAYYKLMLDNGDEINAAKMLELYKKIVDKELVISFAGHFSAGKSSMINALLGQDILPKSPIPTSANIVKITSGEGVARVFFKNENPVEYKEPYDIEIIKSYCKDKDSIESIELSTSGQLIPEACAIYDTPGIDAADDADRLMTESSLHLVDTLFYVMDYNHVQSEVNLHFLKTLQERSIPFYVIVNQIDKHDEKELPFKKFDSSIKQTFDQWNICPEKVFYSSLIDPCADHNQYTEIKQTLFTMMNDGKKANFNTDSAVRQVVTDHENYLKTQYGDEMAEYPGVGQNVENDFQEIGKIETELTKLRNEPKILKNKFQAELNNTLKNAYIMPSSIRDRAEAFLESQQSDFKIGLFASKKKTAEEKAARLKFFITPLKESMEAAIQWKLRDKFINLVTQFNMTDPGLQQNIQDLAVNYTSEDLLRLIKPGAKVNGDYLLNYTNDVAADIKGKFRRKSLTLWDTINQAVSNKNEEKKKQYETQLAALKNAQKMKVEQDTIQAELDKKLSILDNERLSPTSDEAVVEEMKSKIESAQAAITQVNSLKQFQNNIPKKTAPQKEDAGKKHDNNTQTVDSVLQSIDNTIASISDLPGFQTIVNDLTSKQHSLKNRSYTIALFGAFSAGKSSFANALLGESVLPVSPNPTTATVNRIRPVTTAYGHGTVVVTLKDQDTLKDDLLLITKKFSPEGADFVELIQWVQDKGIQKRHQLNKMYQAYLQAMITGFTENKNNIGKTVTITIADFAAYVTDETKACYIESIDLYYDCSITEQGITLVDTPGADSVNARHTNVAFEYIKHADAILYVTYYNHALSRADKDFLMQLGRVKEAFQLDKMFFIVNAADLAVDQEELQLVLNYVRDQLIQLGIRFPSLYPVSSKQSLKNKLDDQKLNEQMQQFEDSFYQFIYHDLSVLTVQSTLQDIKRAYDMMQHYMESLNLDEQEKVAYEQVLLSKRDGLEKELIAIQTNVYDNQLQQKIKKQLFYVLERLSIRFHDMFKESFNPTTINEPGRKAQPQLRNSLQDLIDYVGFELLQELQAVSLRIEGFIQSQASELFTDLATRGRNVDDTFVLPNFAPITLETPAYEKAFKTLDTSEFDKALAMFKGTKAFFEKNEKELMKEAIYERLQPHAKQYFDKNDELMVEFYLKQWQEIIKTIKIDITRNVEEHIDSYLEMIASPVDMTVLTNKLTNLASVLNKHNMKDV